MSSVEGNLRTLSQRELRNQSGDVLRAVQGGETFVITNSGKRVAILSPLDEAGSLPVSRPARRVGGWKEVAKDRTDRFHVDTARDIEYLRGERV